MGHALAEVRLRGGRLRVHWRRALSARLPPPRRVLRLARPFPPTRSSSSATASPATTTGSRPAGLSLQDVDIADVAAHREVWEKVVRKMRAGAMPPRPRPRPDDATYARVLASVETGPRRGRPRPDPTPAARRPSAV